MVIFFGQIFHKLNYIVKIKITLWYIHLFLRISFVLLTSSIIKHWLSYSLKTWWGLEYADCVPCRWVRWSPTPKKMRVGLKCDIKLYLMVRFEIWWVWNTPSLSLLPGPLWSKMVVRVRVQSMSQVDLFKNFLHLIRLSAKK